MDTIQDVLRACNTRLTEQAAKIIDIQEVALKSLKDTVEDQMRTIDALNMVIGLADTTLENIKFADQIRSKALDDAAKVVMADLLPNPEGNYQAQHNRGIATLAHKIRNLK